MVGSDKKYKQFLKGLEKKAGMSISDIKSQSFCETKVYHEKKYADFTGKILPQKKGKVLMSDGTYIKI